MFDFLNYVPSFFIGFCVGVVVAIISVLRIDLYRG